MSNYDNSYSGTFGKNKNKEPGSRQPDWKGQININGVPHWLDGWTRASQDGDKFISVVAKPKEQQGQGQAPRQAAQRPAPSQRPQRPSSGFDDMDDDVPY